LRQRKPLGRRARLRGVKVGAQRRPRIVRVNRHGIRKRFLMNTATPANDTPITDSVRHLVDEADQFIKAAAQTGDARFEAVRERFVDQVRQLRTQLEDLEDGALHRARRAARHTDLMVHAHPYGAVGLGVAVGMLIGLLAGRR
jgi:ElaB/YqjD/DUF883 family membrane-anchored ribosome-binding protein